MFLKSHKQKICEVAEEVQKSVDLEFAKVNEKPEPGIALDQAGLKDGKEIITSFLESGETQLAIDHLLYMIKETNVRISRLRVTGRF